MSKDLTAHLIRERWDKQLAALLKLAPQLGQDLLTPQLRLLLEKIIKFTPPNKGYQQGRLAVKRDIRRAVKPLLIKAETTFLYDEWLNGTIGDRQVMSTSAGYRNKALGQAIAARDYEVINIILKRSAKTNPKLRSLGAAPWSPELHRKRRGSRGRVKSNSRGATFIVGAKDQKALKKYTTAKLKNVGLARAGWLAGLHLVGGKAPRWVERHRSKPGLSAVRDLRRHGSRPYIEVSNSSPYARYSGEARRIVLNAMQSRSAAMRTHLRRLLKEHATRLGLAA